MFKKLFKSKKEENNAISIYAPIDGEVVPLEDVPDPVFSKKMMGDGVAIKPNNGTVVSPVQGKIMQVFPTKHAIGIQAENGTEILLHIGLETVNLNGEGFTTHIEEGDNVKVGDALVTFEKEIVEEKAKSTITPVIITNTAEMKDIQMKDTQSVQAGQDEIIFVSKG